MISVAILVVLTTLAGSNLGPLIGRYRMNGAARQFQAAVEEARVSAISDNREFALRLLEADPAPADGDVASAAGAWEVLRGDRAAGSTHWERVTDGLVELHGARGWAGVSLEPWTPLAGPRGYALPDAVVFSPRGYIVNTPQDFEGGVLRFVFRNKGALAPEARVVRINQGGGARIAAVD